MHITLQKTLSYNRNSNFCPIILKNFIDILLPNPKPILVGVLYWLPGKSRFIEYPDNSLKENNISNIQACYLIRAFNISMLSGNKMLLDKQYYDSCSQASPLVKKYMYLDYSHSLHQLTTEQRASINPSIHNENYRAYCNIYRLHFNELSRKGDSE